MAGQACDLTAGREFPDIDRHVFARCDDVAIVGRERGGMNFTDGPVQSEFFDIVGAEIPEEYDIARADDVVAI